MHDGLFGSAVVEEDVVCLFNENDEFELFAPSEWECDVVHPEAQEGEEEFFGGGCESVEFDDGVLLKQCGDHGVLASGCEFDAGEAL